MIKTEASIIDGALKGFLIASIAGLIVLSALVISLKETGQPSARLRYAAPPLGDSDDLTNAFTDQLCHPHNHSITLADPLFTASGLDRISGPGRRQTECPGTRPSDRSPGATCRKLHG